ncbi:MAG: FecR family protein [Spirochaetales bacterium]|jgi:hypothetical protein|nr:FecR family protein [Spirochaetales bacterium]
MQKNKNLKLLNRFSIFFDILVVLVCTAAAALCIYYFRLDFYQTLSRQNEEPVGTITYKYKAVQRRFVDRLLWDRLRRETMVYNGDFIRTEDLSEATVSFFGGGIVDLAENSLIQIFAQQSVPRLDVTSGGVSVDARNSDFVVSSGGNTVTVEFGGVVSTRTDSGGKMDLWVSEGRATVSTQEGVHEAGAGSAISLNQSGGVETVPMTAVLSPRPNARLISQLESGLSVDFVFNPVHYTEEHTRLEISASRNFEEKILSRDLQDNRTTVRLDPGVWWWRAYPAKSGQATASAPDVASTPDTASAALGKITILYIPPPALLTPADRQVFVFRTEYPDIHYRWNGGENAARYYLLEVADNPALENPVFQIRLQGTSALNSQLGPGQWYWRVSPDFSAEYEGSPQPSSVFSFIIEQRSEFPAPALISPAAQSIISIARSRDDAWFSWKSPAEMESYTLRISRNQDLSAPILNRTVRNSYFIYGAQETLLEEGRYYWGVFGTSAAEDSLPSPVWSFDATPALSALFPPDNYTLRDTGVSNMRFSWKGTIPARRLQISREAGFSSLVVDEPVTGDSHRISRLDTGTWYWRVTAEGEQSMPRLFTVNPTATPSPAPEPAIQEIPAPAPATPPTPRFEPSDNFIFPVEYLRENQSIHFSWPPASPGGGYTFTLSHADGSRILSVPLSDNSFTLRDLKALSNGQFVWQVKAGNTTIAENRFTLTVPDVHKTELRDLGTVFSVQGASDTRLKQRITWFRDENASHYELVVEKKDGSGYTEVFRDISRNASAEIPVDRGAYRFKLLIYNLLGQFQYETNWASFNIILAQ